MEFKLIQSGRDKIQILDQGFRLKRNKGPSGPYKTSYFVCEEPGCKARAETLGDLTLTDLSLKYHHFEQHTLFFFIRTSKFDLRLNVLILNPF